MATTSAAAFKITYSSANADLTQFHKDFDAALALVRSKTGKLHPLWIDDKAVTSASEPLK